MLSRGEREQLLCITRNRERSGNEITNLKETEYPRLKANEMNLKATSHVELNTNGVIDWSLEAL